MISKAVRIFLNYKIWLLTIASLNIIFAIMLWLLDTSGFSYIFSTMLLGSLVLYCGVGFFICRMDQRKEEAVLDFLEHPEESEERIPHFFSENDKVLYRKIGETLREKNTLIKNQEQSMEEYVEYIESWAHEIKTPLALMTFVLDNRKEEISSVVYQRLEYTRTKMQEDIERMLYYARLKSARSDYFFKELSLQDICYEVIEEYEILLQEQKIRIITELEDVVVVSDKKGLLFILRQVISNAIKYKKQDINSPLIRFFVKKELTKNLIRLTVRDNGIGVKSYDLSLIFGKGFTGEIGEQRKNSTGMGLYLVKQVAEDLNIKIEVSEEYTDGFEISFLFPSVTNLKHNF